ncbi:hypothetical protein AGR7A_Cc130047 [Agrobacterium deltaense NCPPB 1641]|uniref:Uncharacterized protein n=1 Tax=Agrobacterium deltaense NCPPB 1641 TaxID=1183425 RepID=A0A1S7TJP8_9HYPH|nr:hypothetical protein AGR7A_Cc130047 [Agrobacterium deltaense NCPPB 1641]
MIKSRGWRLTAEFESVSSVMLGPVPSICNVAIGDMLADPRHKAEDDVEYGVRLVIGLPPMT